MAEGTRLLSGRRSKAYRGFESLPLRELRAMLWRVEERCGAEALDASPGRSEVSAGYAAPGVARIHAQLDQ